MVAQQRRERACRADDRARVRERGARSGLRAPDLEADDGLAGLGCARQRRGERVRPPDRLDEQADRARALVLGQERDEIGDVARELAARGDDGAKADPRPACQERLADRARVSDAGDVPGHERLRARHRAEPQRDAAGRRNAHAVGPDHRDVALGGACADARRDRATLGPGLGAQAGQHDGAHTGGDRVLEGGFCARVADQQVRALRRAPASAVERGDALAAEDGRPVRIHEPGRHAAVQHLLEVGGALGRAVARTDHRDRAREEQGADAAAQSRPRSRDERTEPGLGLRRLQAAVMAAQLLLESAGLAPPGLDAGARQHDDVAHPLAEARRDARPEDAVGRELRRRHDPGVVAEELLEQAERLVERALAHVQEEVARGARRRQRPAVGAAAQERHELRAALVDVDAALGVGRKLAVVGEQQHERARRARQAPTSSCSTRLEQLERDGLRARIVRPELVPRRVEVVEVEEREGGRRGTCEPVRASAAPARALSTPCTTPGPAMSA